MQTGLYEVLKDGFIAGVYRRQGEVIEGTDGSMRYLVLGEQVRKQEPKPAAAEPAPEAEPADAKGGKKK